MPVDFFEVERQLVARIVLDGLYSQPGIDVVPARAEQFLSKIPYEFKFLSKGKSRYVYAINVPQVIGIGLVLKLGGKHQNNLEVENTKKFPGDFPRIYGAFDYAIVAEQAEMIDPVDDPRMKQDGMNERLSLLKKRYGDVGSNIGFIGDRMVMVDGGVPVRGN